jgi:cysteine desulfurase / selenocysteine lyase
MIDIQSIKNDFPIFNRKINGKQITYLDSTASSLKPIQVIDAINKYYTYYTANIFRGIYTTSEEATFAYEDARKKIAVFIHANTEKEVIFTRNTDESISIIAYNWLPLHVSKKDSIATTIIEHHANYVPWQQYSIKSGCTLHIWKLNEDGSLHIDDLDKLITRNTKLLAFTAASNVLGTLTPVKEIIANVKSINPNIITLVDAAQAAPHMPIDVVDWGADIVAFSGHKMLGPSGIGVLWAKEELLESMPPFLYGGDMIRAVHEKETLFNTIPHKFEAGTPFIEGAIGLGAAVSYLQNIGMKNVRQHEKEITTFAMKELSRIKGLVMYGPKNTNAKGGVISFTLPKIHPHDIAQILNEDNIFIRAGFHCAQPLHEYIECGPTARVSFYIYNSIEDVHTLIAGLEKVLYIFNK